MKCRLQVLLIFCRPLKILFMPSLIFFCLLINKCLNFLIFAVFFKRLHWSHVVSGVAKKTQSRDHVLEEIFEASSMMFKSRSDDN